MKPRKKTGGRVKGTPNKRTVAAMAIVDQSRAEGITPLEVMLGAMREAWERGDKSEAAGHAVNAAPYMHPKLSTVKHEGDEENPLRTVTRIELVGYTDGNSSD